MATDKARQYKPSTIRRLDTLSNNECANPECFNKLIARDGHTIVSKICHIEAASKNGPRFNPNMTDDERRHFDNLILLCDECHSIIDNKENELKYTVEKLKEWKRNHESKQQQAILIQKPKLLDLAITAIADYDFDDVPEGLSTPKAFDPDEKIEYNSLKRNRNLIEEYKVFFPKINAIYEELEAQGSFKKEKLLKNIKMVYTRVKGSFILERDNELEIIQKNADDIFEAVEEKISDMIDKSTSSEDTFFAVPIILVDAFLRCKILENPNQL